MNVGMRTVFTRYWWALVLSGIISIIFGLILLFQPWAGALALVVIIGIDAIIIALLLLIRAFRLRSLVHG